ncbi:PQQ-binding-like beta-propeller repeat protein [Paludisphaera sp.]|uniref:outer membrane protein assembly factor BamB family protein n=1 Tax=Paludisphaera sp. TaxID=2017432 RepID=UPI00301E3BF7
MATLEIHDADGRARFVELARDHPVLLGSSPACDVVLSGEGVLPVHGRIRWKGRRFKIDASPDAEYLEINGRKIVSASLHQGDEIRVGPCRVFALRLDDAPADAPPAAAPRKKKRPRVLEDEGPTKVLQGAASSVEAPTLNLSRPPRAPAPAAPPSVFERDDLLVELGLTGREPEPLAGPSARTSTRAKEPGAVARLLARWRKAREAEDAPGREPVASSPTVIALALLLAGLVAMGFWLATIIASTVATRSYNHAVNLLEDGDNATAIREFDSFLEKNPDDRRAGKARTLRALANVRQYIAISGETWSRALEAAREMVEQTGDLPEFRDEKTELGELVIRIGEGLAERARRRVDPEALAEAESAVPLHATIVGEPAPAFLTKSRLPDLLNEARAAIRKADARKATLAAMEEALAAGSASAVYKARDALVRTYGDLSRDAEVVARMVRANDLMRAAAKVDPSRRPAETGEPSEPLGPPTTLVFRSRDDAPPAPGAAGLAFAAVDGSAYALDGETGAPLWRASVGLNAPFAPLPVPGDPSVLLVDGRRDELARRDARGGRLIWRQSLGEPVDGPPLVVGDRLYQTLPSGKVLTIALADGEVLGSVDLAFPLSRSPVGDESGRFLYVMGRKDCLFTLSRDPLSCVDVQYLGHAEGAIPCPPARLGRFLVVVENDKIADGRWLVLVLEEEGAKPRAAQSIDVAGWTWDVPPTSSSSIWSIGDRGGMRVFAAGDYGSANPLRPLAVLAPDADASGPAFGLAPTERQIWIAGGRSARYDLDAEAGSLATRFQLGPIGVAAGPVQLVGRRVVLSNRFEGGGVALRGIDQVTGRVGWTTVLGAAWPSPPIPSADGESLVTVDRAGRRIRLDRSTLEHGGFVSALLARPGDPNAPDGRLRSVVREGEELALIVPARGGREIWAEAPSAPGGWARTDLPSAIAAPPLPWAGGLLVPGEDGRAYLVDPTTGRADAEPFVPEFDRDRVGSWLAPQPLDADSVVLADDTGRVRRLALKADPARRIAVEAETALDQPIVADPACAESAVVVVTADGVVRALSARDLGAVGSWKLDAPPLGAPRPVAGRVVVLDSAGGVMLLERDGRLAWTTKLASPAVGPPLIRGDMLWIPTRDGRARGLALADGREAAAPDLGVEPAGGLIAVGGDVFVPTGRGVLQPLRIDPATEAQP